MGAGRVLYIHPSKLPVDKPCDWSAGASPYLLAPMGVIGLANLSHRVDGQPVHNDLAYHAGLRELEALDFVDTSFFVGDARYARFQSSDFGRLSGQWLCVGRGCHMNCGFCGGSKKSHLALSGQEAILTRRPEVVADDIARLPERGLNQVSLSHDPAVLGKPYWSKLFQAILDRKAPTAFYNECWQLPGPDWVDALA